MTAKRKPRLLPTRVAQSWDEVPHCIEARAAKTQTVAYGISRSISGNEVIVDCGDTGGQIGMAKLTFRTHDQAWAAYCKGIRLSVKVVEHPEHDL